VGVNHAPGRFNQEKLAWLNQQYIKEADAERLAELTRPFLAKQGIDTGHGPELAGLMPLLKERVSTIVELADAAHIFYRHNLPAQDEIKAKLEPAALPAFEQLRTALADVAWDAAALGQLFKDTAKGNGLKMGQIGIPLRLVLFGTAQTPSIDATLVLLGREETLRRFDSAWAQARAEL
jgi:glutamyl-tRNA synthetase